MNINKTIFILIACFAFICPAATTYTLSSTDITVAANSNAIITQSDTNTVVSGAVIIKNGATVTLRGINAKCYNKAPITCEGNATIILADGYINKVVSEGGSNSLPPVSIEGDSSTTVLIKGETLGTGCLVARAGSGQLRSYNNNPGIGCKANSSGTKGGNIVIESGVIDAEGGSGGGTGIGSGSLAQSYCGDITIKGGTIIAEGHSGDFYSTGAAGIGSGYAGKCGNIKIIGGKVLATGANRAAGIGSASKKDSSRSECGTITISGGTVEAVGGCSDSGGCRGSGIGTGEGNCGNIIIDGGTVTARSSGACAAIGTGQSNLAGKCGTIQIKNRIAKVVAKIGRTSGISNIIGASSSSTSCGTVTFDSKLKQTKSTDNLTLMLTPTYTITWKNEDGTTLETDARVDRDVVPTYNGATPTKAATAQQSYTFKGWTPAVAAATADKTYTATYNATVRSYKVTWKDDDGTILRVDSVQYGTSPGYGEEPTRDGYTFDGWFTAAEGGDLLSEGTIVTKDMSFFAHWKRSSFLAGEDVACAGVNVTLASAQAEWLNGLGGYETVKTAVAAMGSDKLEEAYLLNLDLTNAERRYAFEVVGIDARGAEVAVTVRLVRSGAVQSSGGKNAPINGVLRLYGSKTPEKNGFVPMADAVVSDATFASGETAKLTLSKSGGNRFFHAVIAAP